MLGEWIQKRKRRTVIALDVRIIAMSKKGMSELIKSESDVDWPFLFLTGWAKVITSLFQLSKEIYWNIINTVWWMRPEEWINKIWMLHHDNASTHLLLLILTQDDSSLIVALQIQPIQTFLFSKLKSCQFQMTEELEKNSLWHLSTFPDMKKKKKLEAVFNKGGQ